MGVWGQVLLVLVMSLFVMSLFTLFLEAQLSLTFLYIIIDLNFLILI